MPISIIIHHLLLLPTAALLHIGTVAKPRFLGLATGPICWFHPPTLLKSALPSSFVFIDSVLPHDPLLVNCVKSRIFCFN